MPEQILKTIQNINSKAGQISDKIGQDIVTGITKIGTTVPNKIKGQPPEPPPILPPTRMPTSSDARAAQRQSIIDQLRRRGRASTILTDNTDTLG